MTIGELVAHLRSLGIAVSVRDGGMQLSGTLTSHNVSYWIDAVMRAEEIVNLLCPNARKVLH